MTADEHQRMVDIAQLQVHEYFDHYLTDVFPTQICLIMDAHDKDGLAHETRLAPLYQAKKSFERFRWMILGGAAVVGCLGTLAAEHLGAIIKALLP
jgi:hypothetical protein